MGDESDDDHAGVVLPQTQTTHLEGEGGGSRHGVVPPTVIGGGTSPPMTTTRG